MARTSKQDWYKQGIHTLTMQGANGLTIDALTLRLGVTKGSFYHHFENMQAYIDALLAFYETEGTLNIIAITERFADPRAKLRALLDLTTGDEHPSEIAFRAWALQNPQVRVVQERIDSQRIAYMVDICRTLTGSEAAATSMSRLLYLIYVGNQGVLPPFDGATIQRLYREILRLYLPDEA